MAIGETLQAFLEESIRSHVHARPCIGGDQNGAEEPVRAVAERGPGAYPSCAPMRLSTPSSGRGQDRFPCCKTTVDDHLLRQPLARHSKQTQIIRLGSFEAPGPHK